MVIDAHCHASTRWYEPVETLLFNMDRSGVERAVLIPLLGSLDNADSLAAVARHPDRLIWFAAVDPTSPTLLDDVRKARDAGARGLRMRANWRGGDNDGMALWTEAAQLGLAISLVGPAASFLDGALADVADRCPDLVLILEHLGGLARPDVGDRDAMLEPVVALAAYANIVMKLPGLGQLAPRLANIDDHERPLDLSGARNVLDAMVRAFGSHRLMWGSDFPPVAAREGYDHALTWTRTVLAEQQVTDIEAIFGGTAARFLG